MDCLLQKKSVRPYKNKVEYEVHAKYCYNNCKSSVKKMKEGLFISLIASLQLTYKLFVFLF